MIAEGGFVHVVFALIKRTAIDKKVVPLTQSEIANELGMSKAKVNSLIGQLQNEEYVSLATRGKYVLSEKAILLIESMRRTDTKLLKDEN